MNSISSQFFGLTDYQAGIELQQSYWGQVKGGQLVGKLIGLEHPNVITLGVRGNHQQDVSDSFSGIPVVAIDRGGQATLHSPGQLVIYPIVNIKALGLGVSQFVELLLKTTQITLAQFGIQTYRADGAGLLTENGKICFVGIRVQEGVCRHGIAINCMNDLGLFASIRPCGIGGQAMDRMANYNSDIAINTVFALWAENFIAEIQTWQKPQALLSV